MRTGSGPNEKSKEEVKKYKRDLNSTNEYYKAWDKFDVVQFLKTHRTPPLLKLIKKSLPSPWSFLRTIKKLAKPLAPSLNPRLASRAEGRRCRAWLG